MVPQRTQLIVSLESWLVPKTLNQVCGVSTAKRRLHQFQAENVMPDSAANAFSLADLHCASMVTGSESISVQAVTIIYPYTFQERQLMSLDLDKMISHQDIDENNSKF